MQKTQKLWGISSVGSERLPYKQDVGGSNPSFPTEEKALQILQGFFVCIKLTIHVLYLYSPFQDKR